jgi:hypothetical protein
MLWCCSKTCDQNHNHQYLVNEIDSLILQWDSLRKTAKDEIFDYMFRDLPTQKTGASNPACTLVPG